VGRKTCEAQRQRKEQPLVRVEVRMQIAFPASLSPLPQFVIDDSGFRRHVSVLLRRVGRLHLAISAYHQRGGHHADLDADLMHEQRSTSEAREVAQEHDIKRTLGGIPQHLPQPFTPVRAALGRIHMDTNAIPAVGAGE